MASGSSHLGLFPIKGKDKNGPVFAVTEVRKKLFMSPVVERGDIMSDGDSSLTLMNRLQIEHDTELSYKALQKDDMHEQRMKNLRQLLKTSDDDWRYPNVDKLIGLS